MKPSSVDFSPLERLVGEIQTRMNPRSVWLFGSRSRGDDRLASDYDLLVVLPDHADSDLFDPLAGWEIQHDLGIPATILTVGWSDVESSWNVPNTLAYDIAREGRRLVG